MKPMGFGFGMVEILEFSMRVKKRCLQNAKRTVHARIQAYPTVSNQFPFPEGPYILPLWN